MAKIMTYKSAGSWKGVSPEATCFDGKKSIVEYGRMPSATKTASLLCCIAILLLAGCSTKSDNQGAGTDVPQVAPVSDTIFGQVKGAGDRYNTLSWLGIKYAKAPQGELRWKAPRDPDSWQGILNATSFCNACVQYGTALNWVNYDLYGKPQGCEDCLCLNIWRPNTSDENLPVFVYLHGGANLIGSSSLDVYNGARLSSNANMIVVTVNYRLGLMGWFYHPALTTGNTLDDSGNYGTLDIIKSLEWVKANIKFFGGNPDNVTIAGQSAGAINVLSLMASPLVTKSADLFHKAVIHSGFLISSPMKTAQERSLNVIRRLLIQEGLASSKAEADTIIAREGTKLGEYLRNLPAEKIYHPDVATKTGATSDIGIETAFAMFGIYEDGTVIDGTIIDKIANIPNPVPVIIGCNSKELKMFLMMGLVKPEKLYKVINNPSKFNKASEIIGSIAVLGYERAAKEGQRVFENYGVLFTADQLKKNNKAVYAYNFVWENGTKPYDFLLGGSHAEDVPFLFGNFLPQGESLIGMMWDSKNKSERETISKEMMAYWGSFAWYGDPNTSSGQPLWQEYSDGKRLVIGKGNPYMTEVNEGSIDLECPTCLIDGLLGSLAGSDS